MKRMNRKPHPPDDDVSPDSATEATNSILEAKSSERADVTIEFDIDEETGPTTEATNSGEVTTSPSVPENKAGSKDDPDDKPIPENDATN